MSIIVSQNKKVAIDDRAIRTYFVAESQFEGYIFSISINGEGKGKINWMGEYKSELEAKKAMEAVIRAVASGEKIILVPDEDTVQATLHGHTEVWHHATGKKTKGHGGS